MLWQPTHGGILQPNQSWRRPTQAGGAVTFALDWTAHVEVEGPGNPNTFTAVAIGAADPDRIVAVGAWARVNADTDSITGMTIGGVTATQVPGARVNRSDGGAAWSDIWYAAVPTGTTANIVVSFNTSVPRIGISTYRIVTSTPAPSSVSNGFGVGAGCSSGSVTVPGGGAGFAMFGSRNQGDMTVWTNATLDYNAADGTSGKSSAKFTATNAITATGNGSAGCAISAAAWS